MDTVSGEVKVKANMDHKSSFSITPPVYADGMVFVALSGGTVQAFNAATLESLWIYTDKLGRTAQLPAEGEKRLSLHRFLEQRDRQRELRLPVHHR